MAFQPSPGQVLECDLPAEEGIEIIAAIGAGKFVSPYYDSMVAQIVAHGPDRAATAEKLANYLQRVKIRGICTNLALVKRVLRDEVFLRGDYDTGYLPEFLSRLPGDELIAEIAASGATDGDIGLETIAIEDSDELKVLAPATGIFYLTPSPTEPPFVAVGDQVDVDTTLCQLEAFKIFTPIRLADFNAGDAALYDASQRFEVVRVNVESGAQVNAGDLLFVVRPLASP